MELWLFRLFTVSPPPLADSPPGLFATYLFFERLSHILITLRCVIGPPLSSVTAVLYGLTFQQCLLIKKRFSDCLDLQDVDIIGAKLTGQNAIKANS